MFGILPFEATYHGPWGLQPRTWRSRQNMRGQNKMGKRAYTISETFISDTLQERERNLEKLAAEYLRILEKRLVHTGA